MIMSACHAHEKHAVESRKNGHIYIETDGRRKNQQLDQPRFTVAISS